MAEFRWLWQAAGLDAPAGEAGEAGDLGRAWREAAQAAGLDEEALAARVAAALGLPVAPLEPPHLMVMQRLDRALAARHACVPFREDAGLLHLACADPTDPQLPSLVTFATGLRPLLHVVPHSRLAAWRNLSPAGTGAAIVLTDETDAGDADTVQFVAVLLGEAVQARASDIHLQPHLGAGLVRLRVDGVLVNFTTIPAGMLERVVGRIKAVSGMDPANRRIPQDGRCSARIDDRTWDLRIATLPVDRSERMVIRLLGGLSVSGLASLDLRDHEANAAREAFRNHRGLFVITGPTGSGKSTTLYAALHELNRPDLNIVTVEDPVEYRLPGISQCEVEPAAGLDFAAALRQLMRQDPNVILVGEVRDQDTAEAAFRAALTGHRVLTTLHAVDAMGAVPRLRDLGLRPRLVGDALAAVSAQRLMRRLCPACRVPCAEPLSREEKVFADLAGQPPPFRPVGCPACGGAGYRGRLPILEVVPITPEIRELIHDDAPYTALLKAARAAGAKSLGERASVRILLGDTTVEEALRVLGGSFWRDLQAAFGRSVDGDLPMGEPAPEVGPPGVLYIGGDGELAAAVGQALGADGATLQQAPDLLVALSLRRRGWNFSTLLVDALALGGDPARFLADARAILGELAWAHAVVLVAADADGARRYLRRSLPGAVAVDPGQGVPAIVEALRRQLPHPPARAARAAQTD